MFVVFFFFFQAEDGIRDIGVTGVQTCALPISIVPARSSAISRGRAPRSSRETSGASSTIAARLRKPASRSPETIAVVSPAIGLWCMSSPSRTVSSTNVGHSRAPRSRQRSRRVHTRSSMTSNVRRPATIPLMDELLVCHLGQVEYRAAADLQERLRELRQGEAIGDVLLLLEHPPVYTRGRRTQKGELPMGEAWYATQGIDVVDTPRGGRVTY